MLPRWGMALINNANQEGIKFYVSSVVDKQQRILLYFQLSAVEKFREPRQAPIFLPYASQAAESFMKVLLILMCSCLLFSCLLLCCLIHSAKRASSSSSTWASTARENALQNFNLWLWAIKKFTFWLRAFSSSDSSVKHFADGSPAWSAVRRLWSLDNIGVGRGFQIYFKMLL